MNAKIFEVVLHKLPSGKSPTTALEEQINIFLREHPALVLNATQMSSIVMPPQPNAMPDTTEASVIMYCLLFYTE